MFENVMKLDYLGMEQKQSQQGNSYNIITLGNSASYEKYQFYADPSITISAGVGSPVKATIKAVLQRGFVNFVVTKIELFKE